jgi:hypothetical protein
MSTARETWSVPYFQVATEALTSAGGLVGVSDTELAAGRGVVAGSSGACVGTLAAAGYESLVDTIDHVVTGVQGAVGDLQDALQMAAISYAAADTTAARDVSVKGG